MALNESSPLFNYKINLGESSLMDYINKSVYEEIKQEQETNEILNHLRMKYLPNSVRSNSFNKSMNLTYFQRNNSNKLFSTFDNKTSYLNNNNFPKTAHASFNKFNLMNNQADLKPYNNERRIPYSYIGQKQSYNLGETNKLNRENINYEKNENHQKDKGNKYKEDFLIQENNNLKNINDCYRLIISTLIEYINDISNHFIRQNTFEMNYVNNILKVNNFKMDNSLLNNFKEKLNAMKNKIINFNIIKKSQTVPLKNIDKNIFDKEKEPITKENNKENFKENNKEKYEYKPIIFERNKQNIEKYSKSEDRGGKIKRARTWLDRLPKTYWSLNKKVKFREIFNYKV